MKVFSEEIKNAFGYAIETEDAVLFDALASRFCSESQELKNELLLLTAQKAKTPNLIEKAIALGGDLSYRDENWATLLHHAVASSHVRAVQFFIDKGLSVEVQDKKGFTPLCTAAVASCSRKTLKALLNAGADIHVRTGYGNNLLTLAAAYNDYTDFTRFFLEQGLSPEDRNKDGYTALLASACYQKNISVMETLIKEGNADMYARASNGDTMFHLAAMNWDPSPAEWLKDYFSTSEKNNAGETCLERALSSAVSGRTLSVYLKKMQQEHLLLACKNSGYDIMEALMKAGYNVNLKDKNGATALMHAAKEAQSICVAELLRQGADENKTDNKNRNVLHYAAANTDRQVFEITNMLLGGENSVLFTAKDNLGNIPEYYITHKDEF